MLLLLLLLQMRKAANRMNFDFNVAEDEYIDGDEVVGLGTINKEGTGRLRLVASQQKVKMNAKQEKKYRARLAGAGTVSGLSSTLAFTPVQVSKGFEFVVIGSALFHACWTFPFACVAMFVACYDQNSRS